jgi:hypothetical protein
MDIVGRRLAARTIRGCLRPALGFLLAPLLPPLLYLGGAGAFGWFLSIDLAMIVGEAAYLAALLGGVPLHVVLSKLGWVSLHDYMALGAPLGAVCVLIGERAPVELIVLFQALLAAFAGALSGGLFWLIVRPDRQAADS